jgi:transcriptional regulator with XRE-family HTH domain
LHACREAAGLTQAQVAENLGISSRAYAFWEREPVALRPEQIAKLAAVLGLSVEDLVGGNGTKRRGNGPAGKMRRLFEAASKLPRSQQEKVAAVLEPFIKEHAVGAH